MLWLNGHLTQEQTFLPSSSGTCYVVEWGTALPQARDTKAPFFFFSPTHWSKEGLAAYWSSRDHFSFKCFWCLKLFAGYTPHCKQPALPCKALPLLHLSCTEAILSTGFYGKGIYLVHLSGLPAVLSPFSSSTASGLVCHHNPGTTQPAFWLYSCNSPLESL